MNHADILRQLELEVRNCRLCVEHPQGKPLPHEPRPVVRSSAAAKILIAGQAPGTKVHASGIPFDDRSGDRLREWLGMSRDEFYDRDKLAILAMGFCFPGQNAKGSDLPPRRECAPVWRARFMASMPQIELVLVIGLYAQAWHLGDLRSPSLTETVADWRHVYDKSPFENSSGHGENGGFRASERSVYKVREHRSAEKRHSQTAITNFQTGSKTSNPHILPLPHPSWRNTGWLKKNPWFESDLLPFLRSEVDRLLGRR